MDAADLDAAGRTSFFVFDQLRVLRISSSLGQWSRVSGNEFLLPLAGAVGRKLSLRPGRCTAWPTFRASEFCFRLVLRLREVKRACGKARHVPQPLRF